MTKELQDELVAAWNSGYCIPPDEPKSPLDRLRAEWAKATPTERALFKMEIG
jgi:hypothetical protein